MIIRVMAAVEKGGSDASEGRRQKVILGGCWATVVLALGCFLARLDGLPASIPVFVSPAGTPTEWAPTSMPMVTRIALMGAGQLGVAEHSRTVLGEAAIQTGPACSIPGDRGCGKTLAESLSLAGTGTGWGETMGPALHAITVLIVVAFLLTGIVMWRRGLLRRFPEMRSQERG